MIAPVYKGGNHELAKSYRPIALMTHLSKILEIVIKIQMVEFLEMHGLIDDSQHGSSQAYLIDHLCYSLSIGHLHHLYEI